MEQHAPLLYIREAINLSPQSLTTFLEHRVAILPPRRSRKALGGPRGAQGRFQVPPTRLSPPQAASAPPTRPSPSPAPPASQEVKS